MVLLFIFVLKHTNANTANQRPRGDALAGEAAAASIFNSTLAHLRLEIVAAVLVGEFLGFLGDLLLEKAIIKDRLDLDLILTDSATSSFL